MWRYFSKRQSELVGEMWTTRKPHFNVINMEIYTMCAAREKQTRSFQIYPLNRRIENPGEILSSDEVQCSIESEVSLNPQICCDFHYCLILSLCCGDGPCFSYISLSGIIRSLRQTDSFDFKNYLLDRHHHHHMFNSWLNSKVVRLTVRGESHLLKLNKPAC